MTGRSSAWVLAVAGLAGACSMALELSAVRLIAPWFGTSSTVWTHVIGAVLLALSVGYLLGARLSRGSRPERALGWCLLCAGATTAWLPAAASPVTGWFRPGEVALDEAAGLLQWGSLASALTLFLPPILMLGCVAPLSAEIVQRIEARAAGDAGGRVLAVSTLGSIAGTFATTYVVLPGLGLTRTYVGAGVLLAGIGLLLLFFAGPVLRAGRLAVAAVALSAVLGSRMRVPAPPEGWRLVDAAESEYQSIRVVEGRDSGRLFRKLQVNEGFDSFQSVWQESPGLLPDGYYYNLFVLPPWWSRAEREWSVFVLGLGAGTTWRVLAGALPPGATLRAAGAEIDPAIVTMGERWFEMRSGSVLSGWDARTALRAQAERFDEIVLDAYANQMEIPAHLCTVEFFAEVQEKLVPGGWLTVNIGGFGFSDPVVEAVARTAARAFGQKLLALRVPFSRNCVLFVRSGAEPLIPGGPDWHTGVEDLDKRLSALAIDGAWRWFEPGEAALLTDDHNPIELLQRRSIREGKSRWLSSP